MGLLSRPDEDSDPEVGARGPCSEGAAEGDPTFLLRMNKPGLLPWGHPAHLTGTINLSIGEP